MAAPKHNQNARKWTPERVLGYLAEIKTLARDPKRLFLGKVLAELGLHKNIWAYWQHKFADDDDISYQMDLIKDRFESNLYSAALRSEVSAAFAIMCLKANYSWRDDRMTEVRHIAGERHILAGGYSRAA